MLREGPGRLKGPLAALAASGALDPPDALPEVWQLPERRTAQAGALPPASYRLQLPAHQTVQNVEVLGCQLER